MAQTLEDVQTVTIAPTGWLDRFALVLGRFVPDAITAAIIFMLVLAVMALALGNSPARVLDAYSRGLWSLLAFTMQMTLIITLSSALGATPFFRKLILKLAQVPRTTTQMLGLAVLIIAIASYLFWGLGLAFGTLDQISKGRPGGATLVIDPIPLLQRCFRQLALSSEPRIPLWVCQNLS